MSGPSDTVMRTVIDRADGRCELCRHRLAVELQHRRPRGMGGTSVGWVNRPANLVAVCRPCHQRCESEPGWVAFSGVGAFDRHQRTGDDLKPVCVDPPDAGLRPHARWPDVWSTGGAVSL